MMTKEKKELYSANQFFMLELLKQLPVYVFWKDKSGRYLGCNDRFAQALGFNSVEAVIGKTDYDFPIKESDRYRSDDKEIMESGIAKLNIEEEQTFSDGKKVFLLTSKIPVLDKNKEVIGILGVYSDISDLKKAKNVAEEANRAKTEFLANMSHDLRTPLTGIISLASLQSQDTSSSENRKYSQMICGAGEQLLELLNYVLEVVAAENSQQTIQKERVDLIQLAKELQELMLPAITAKGLQLHLNLNFSSNQFQYIETDRIILKRVLLNLLSNAVKFTEKGSISLIIKSLLIESNPAIEISVQDTGIGIAKAYQEKIFDRFYRINTSKETTHEGYGVGLYLVKKAVELLGGEIALKSSEGKGSKFSLYFQLAWLESVTQFEPTVNAMEVVAPPTAAGVTLANHTVLLVEDNSLILHAITSLLKKLACRVITAADGKSAVNYLTTQAFDWVLLDMRLPELDGIEVVKHYRAWEEKNKKAHLPIFVLTANMLDSVKQQWLGIKVDHIFIKPFTEQDVQTIVHLLENPVSKAT
jgi:two-component system, OmpR family, aerobic respiration control sensor histidine kinase ArcB